MNAKTSVLLVLTLIFVLMLCGAASAGTPLQENQTGTVSGDLYVNTTDGWPSSTQGATNEVTQANTLPAYTSIESAWVYVNVYSGSGSSNWPVRTTIKLDGNGDGDYDDTGETLGVEDMNIPGTTDGTVYWLNDHCNRVYSDYQVWYDVKNIITSTNPTLYVKTESIGGDGYDGRIKLLALCVAHNDGDTDQVHYWVLNGQDWINADTSPSTSSFNTSSFNGQVSNATLNTVALSGTDGTYTINTNTLTGNLTETGSYYKEHQWNVTNDITPGQNSTLTYANVGSSLKLNLATLAIREVATTLPMADFTATPISGKTPITVNFNDNSTNATGWLWDFGDGNTSTDQNPSHTYNNAGTYTVKLTATNIAGSNTTTKLGYITATASLKSVVWTANSAWNAPDIGNSAKPCFADLDGDGDYDLLIGANSGVSYGYENTGTASSPVWTAKSAWNTPDIGTSASPCFADLDSDGDYDLLIGSFSGVCYGYENTGTASSPVWTAKSTWDTPDTGQCASPCFADLDSDGDYDLLIGDYYTNVYGYKNTGTASSPVWTAKSTWDLYAVASYPSPYFADLDGDGDYDLLIGHNNGVCYGYENTGTASSPVWTAKSTWNTPDIGDRASPSLADLDSDGDYDLLVGTSGGNSLAYKNTGSSLSPDLTPTTVSPVILTVNRLWTLTAIVNNTSSVNVGAFVATLSVDGVVVDTQSVLGPNASSSSTVSFSWKPTTAGTYNLTVTTDPIDGISESNENNNTLSVPVTVVVDTQTPTVTASPSGGNLTSAIQVTLLATDDYDTNPTIYYTTDGSDPTTSSTVYTGPISISKTTTLKFIAEDFNDNISTVQTETYTDSEAPTVSAAPTGRDSASAVQVTLSAIDNVTSNPVIYYTTNGTDPTTTSTQYTSSITIAANTILKFIAVDDSGNISSVQSETYTINDTEEPTVTASPAGGTYTSKVEVTLSVSDNVDPNPVIYYTIDGTDPTTNSIQYTIPFYIFANTILKLISLDATGNTSPVQTETYTMIDTDAPTVTANYDSGNYPGTSMGGDQYLAWPDRTVPAFYVILSAIDNIDPNPAIYYTTDGSEPTTNSTLYSEPISIMPYAITTLKFIAMDASEYISPVQNRTFNTYNGDTYLAGRCNNGTDLVNNVVYEEGNIGVRILEYGSYSSSGGTFTRIWTASDLNIPEGVTLVSARLYQARTWYGTPNYTIQFNGHDTQQPIGYYWDCIAGQNVFDVSEYFNLYGENTAIVTGGGAAYASVLIVIYEAASEPYRQIWINEGSDCIYNCPGSINGPGVAWTTFNNVSTANLASAQVITVLPSGIEDGYPVYLNGESIPLNGETGIDPGIHFHDVTSALQNGINELGVPNTISYFNFAIAVLEVTQETAAAPIANFTANTTNGTAPLTVHFTDTSSNTPTSWLWEYDSGSGWTEFGNGTQNPLYTFTTPGIYGIRLTAANAGGNDDETKLSYITVSGTPDLTVNGLTVSNPQVGTNTPVAATVTNNGTADVAAFLVKLYDNNIQVAKTTITSLAAGASAPVNFNWIPTTTGSHVLAVIADVGNQITESDETNNLASALVTVNPSVQSDLLVSNLQLPVSPVIGTTSTVRATVTNLGTDAEAFVVKLYDNNIQYATVSLAGLAAGTNTDVNFNWLTYTSGTHNLSVIADANQQITEYNENNNQISQSTTANQSTLPDLIITNLQLPSSPAVAASSQVTATITNNGTADASAFVVKLYDNNTQYTTLNLTGLAAGASANATFDWLTYTTGTHNLSVIADANQQITEYNENNNQISAQATVNPSTLQDIAVSNLQVPSSPVVAANTLVTATVTNLGTVDSGAFVVKLYDNNVQVAKINLTRLSAGASTDVTFNWLTYTTGAHNLSVIADANQQITEYNENNNQISQQATVNPATQPDLTVTDLQLPSNPVAGTTYQITATVTNLGTVDVGAFAVKLYDNNIQLGKINITSLSAGTSTQVTFNWTPTTGTHNLAIKADANNQITEYNENNNQITQQITVS